MGNFCTNCGAKLREKDNYCTNCGTKVDNSYIKHDNNLKTSLSNIEQEKAKKEIKRVVGGKLSYNKTFGNALIRNGLDIIHTGKAIRQQVEKEIESGRIKSGAVELRVNQLIIEHKIKKEEEKKKLKTIDEIFELAEIKSEIRKNKINQLQVITIKDILKNKIINKKEDMSEEEIKYFIKKELKKAKKEQGPPIIPKEREMSSKKIEYKKNIRGGNCSLGCRHCYEEFLNSGGGIVGDFDDEGYVEYYCHLGHSLNFGRFCEDYE